MKPNPPWPMTGPNFQFFLNRSFMVIPLGRLFAIPFGALAAGFLAAATVFFGVAVFFGEAVFLATTAGVFFRVDIVYDGFSLFCRRAQVFILNSNTVLIREECLLNPVGDPNDFFWKNVSCPQIGFLKFFTPLCFDSPIGIKKEHSLIHLLAPQRIISFN